MGFPSPLKPAEPTDCRVANSQDILHTGQWIGIPSRFGAANHAAGHHPARIDDAMRVLTALFDEALSALSRLRRKVPR